MANYTEYWIDYSARKLSGAAVAGTRIGPGGEFCTGAIRYIDAPNLLSTKHTNKAEYDDLITHGVKVRLVHQGDTTDADGGYAEGVARAQRAKAGAEYLGYNGVIFFCNDRPNLPNVASWRAYLDGAASVLGRERVGAYGFYNALNAAVGHASAFWQAGAEYDLVPHANVYQWNNGRVYVSGTECDLNKVITDPNGSVTPAPSPRFDEEDEMQPVTLLPSADQAYACEIWDGRPAVLNVIATSVDGFVSAPMNWGAAGGTGGGERLGSGWTQVDRVEVNRPGQWRIPAGTTRVFFGYSCGGVMKYQIVPA
ncbi:glycoside hydrolase domain-containing protein [Amycolatopsis sp. NPDC059027]|uniref:glycoside hydrolase domain-containing protein n=1 Tax=Amycolatopsis sp. NPDC059027 TaxID=3346709 RepID=UPI00366B8E1C